MYHIKYITHCCPSIRQPVIHKAFTHDRQCKVPRTHFLRSTQATKNENPSTDQYLTPPLYIEKTENLTQNASAAATPLWGSFCGSIQGLWAGTASAINPTSGNLEPIALSDDGKTKIYEIYQCCVEEREVIEDIDCIKRHTARALSPAELSHEMVAGGSLQFASTSSIDWDEEQIPYLQDGMFYFDGGTYTTGSTSLVALHTQDVACDDDGDDAGEEEDDGAYDSDNGNIQMASDDMDARNDEGDDEYAESSSSSLTIDDASLFGGQEDESSLDEYTTSMIEFSLQWNGEQRARIQITLACGLFDTTNTAARGFNIPELDINVLRVAVCRESWEGIPTVFTSTVQEEKERTSQQVSAASRLTPSDLAGFWNEFEIAAMTVDDVDMKTGMMARMPVYSSQEVQKLFVSPYQHDSRVQGSAVKEKKKEWSKQKKGPKRVVLDGGALWLPHRITLQLTMAPPLTSDDRSDSGDGGGVEIMALWSPEDGLLLGLTRKYDSYGELIEVVNSTAIRAE